MLEDKWSSGVAAEATLAEFRFLVVGVPPMSACRTGGIVLAGKHAEVKSNKWQLLKNDPAFCQASAKPDCFVQNHGQNRGKEARSQKPKRRMLRSGLKFKTVRGTSCSAKKSDWAQQEEEEEHAATLLRRLRFKRMFAFLFAKRVQVRPPDLDIASVQGAIVMFSAFGE